MGRKLNDKGKKLIKKSGMQEYVEKNKDIFFDEKIIKKIDNKYDLQNELHNIIFNRFKSLDNTELEKKIKNFIYENDEWEDVDVNSTNLCYLGSIILMNMRRKK